MWRETYNLNNIDIIVEGLSGNRSRHGDNNESISDERQGKTREGAFRDRLAWVLEISGHTCASIKCQRLYLLARGKQYTYAKIPPVAGNKIPKRS